MRKLLAWIAGSVLTLATLAPVHPALAFGGCNAFTGNALVTNCVAPWRADAIADQAAATVLSVDTSPYTSGTPATWETMAANLGIRHYSAGSAATSAAMKVQMAALSAGGADFIVSPGVCDSTATIHSLLTMYSSTPGDINVIGLRDHNEIDGLPYGTETWSNTTTSTGTAGSQVTFTVTNGTNGTVAHTYTLVAGDAGSASTLANDLKTDINADTTFNKVLSTYVNGNSLGFTPVRGTTGVGSGFSPTPGHPVTMAITTAAGTGTAGSAPAFAYTFDCTANRGVNYYDWQNYVTDGGIQYSYNAAVADGKLFGGYSLGGSFQDYCYPGQTAGTVTCDSTGGSQGFGPQTNTTGYTTWRPIHVYGSGVNPGASVSGAHQGCTGLQLPGSFQCYMGYYSSSTGLPFWRTEGNWDDSKSTGGTDSVHIDDLTFLKYVQRENLTDPVVHDVRRHYRFQLLDGASGFCGTGYIQIGSGTIGSCTFLSGTAYAPKPHYWGEQAFLRAYSDPGAPVPLLPLNYSVSFGACTTCMQVLAQKRNGTYLLALWNETSSWNGSDVTPAAQTATITFGKAPTSITSYHTDVTTSDPLPSTKTGADSTGTSPGCVGLGETSNYYGCFSTGSVVTPSTSVTVSNIMDYLTILVIQP